MSRPKLRSIPLYDVRLVRARRGLRIAEGRIDGESEAASAIHSLIAMTDREHLVVLFVNARHSLTGAHIAAVGGQGSIANCDPRTILRAALLACAGAMILGHNHPSGDPNPSAEDLAFTRATMHAARIVGIPVLDHVIVTRNPQLWHSMHARGTLPQVAQ